MIERAWHDTMLRYDVEKEKGAILSAVVLDVNEELGTTNSIKSISIVDEHI